MAGEAKAPVGEDVAADRQQRDKNQECGQPLQEVKPDRVSLNVVETLPDRPHLAGRDPKLVEESRPDTDNCGGTEDPRHGERREPDPSGVQPGQLSFRAQLSLVRRLRTVAWPGLVVHGHGPPWQVSSR